MLKHMAWRRRRSYSCTNNLLRVSSIIVFRHHLLFDIEIGGGMLRFVSDVLRSTCTVQRTATLYPLGNYPMREIRLNDLSVHFI